MAPPSTAGALAKWWSKFIPARGLVQRTLSPMEQDVLKPLFKNLGAKVCWLRQFWCRRFALYRNSNRVYTLAFCLSFAGQVQKRVTGSILDWGPPVAIGVFTVWWADRTFHHEGLKHRS